MTVNIIENKMMREKVEDKYEYIEFSRQERVFSYRDVTVSQHLPRRSHENREEV